MGLGGIFSFLKPKSDKSSQIPNLDSKSSDIPLPIGPNGAFPNPGFGQQGSQTGSKSGNSLGELPDFPDFPEFGNSKNDMVFPPPPAHGVEPPKPISGSSSFNFDSLRSDKPFSSIPEKSEPIAKRSVPVRPATDIDSRLDDYESYGNDKYIGISPEEDSESNHFVNIHDYKQTLEFVDTMRDNMASFENSSMQLHDLSNNSAVLEDNFRKIVEDIQRKLVFVDKTLFEMHAK